MTFSYYVGKIVISLFFISCAVGLAYGMITITIVANEEEARDSQEISEKARKIGKAGVKMDCPYQTINRQITAWKLGYIQGQVESKESLK